MRQALIVFAKELADALRDRRTLLRMLLPALLMGPVMLMALSALIASFEERAEKREVMAVNIDAAPTLKNFIERQTYTIKPAPADYEARLRATT
ncbi:MAG: ABC transporter permease, partial [Roseateles sp.]